MPAGITTCITWSMLELRGLLEDEENRVVFQRTTRHLGLHPFHLNDLNRALREILDSSVNSYDSELQGLVLGYKKPKLLSPLGAILHDSHFIHVDIEADFYIFKPEIGCILKGIANKKATNHVGVLVHKAFNVSIPKPEDSEEWLGDYVFVGQEVKFIVKDMDFKGKLPFVRGELIEDGIPHSTYDEEAPVATNEEEKISKKSIENGTEIERRKKSPKKARIIDSSDENSDVESKVKVFTENQAKEKKDKTITKVSSLKRKIFISSSDETSEDETKKIETVKSIKRRRVSSDSSESENETISKQNKISPQKVQKVNKIVDTSPESTESVESKSEILDDKQKSPKKKQSKDSENTLSSKEPKSSVKSRKKKSTERKNLDSSSEIDEHINEKLDISKSLEVEKSSRNKEKKSPVKSSKNIENIDAIVEETKTKSKKKKLLANGNVNISSEAEDQIDEKPKIHETLIVEKSTKHKEKKINETTKSSDDSVSPKKRGKINRILDSDDEETTEVEIKDELRGKNKTKSKKKKREIDESSEENVDKTVNNNFEFIKPEIKKETKKKRTKTVVEDKNVTSEQSTSEFLADIRIKSEPDPSDVEDIAEKSDKKKKKRIKEEDKRKKNEKETTSFDSVGIKCEPDASDIEDTKPGKKKIKRKNADKYSFDGVKVKTEPASDVEDKKPKKKMMFSE